MAAKQLRRLGARQNENRCLNEQDFTNSVYTDTALRQYIASTRAGRFISPLLSASSAWTITTATSGGDGWPNCVVHHGDFEVWFPTDRILKAHPGAMRSVRPERIKMLGCSDWKKYQFETLVREIPAGERLALEKCLKD